MRIFFIAECMPAKFSIFVSITNASIKYVFMKAVYFFSFLTAIDTKKINLILFSFEIMILKFIY